VLESKIFKHLSTVNAVSTYVGTRIYPALLPQDPTYPAIVYMRVGSQKEYGLNGYASLERVHIAIDINATGFAQMRDISAAVKAAMDTATGFSAILENENNLYESESEVRIYREILDFSVWNRE
jgi:hypothetical protein